MEPVDLWVVPLDTDERGLQMFARQLSTEELVQASRFRAAMHRDRFIVSQGSLRLLLAHYIAVRPHEIVYQRGRFGKPMLCRSSSSSFVEFNMSHSDAMALIAVSEDLPIGVDVERVRPIIEMRAMAELVLSFKERDKLFQSSETDFDHLFYRFWTCKEACLKQTGEGLNREPSTFEVHFAESGEIVGARTFDGTVQWKLHEFVPAPGFIGALSSPVRPKEVRMRTFVAAAPEWSGIHGGLF